MTNLKLIMCAGAMALGVSWAGVAAADDAPATPMAAPAMGATIAANPHPGTFNAGPLGNVTVDGVFSGLMMYQSPQQFTGFTPDLTGLSFDPLTGDPIILDPNKGTTTTKNSWFDVSNAMVIVNKSDGPVQFYLQAGAYSFPTVGVSYTEAKNQTPAPFGVLPQGYLKLVPNSMFSIQVGALPTLIGAELAFTFQNINIERGLLWNTEPLVSKGVQVNFASGPWAASLAVTDGYYTNQYTNVSGLVSYAFTPGDVLVFAAEGNAGTSRNSGSVANGQIYNLIYTHTSGPWMIQPYFQYQSTPNIPGISTKGSLWAGALLAKYSFTPEISLAGRVEYESESGPFDILGYGAGSNAWSITVTPTYQKGIFFARAELSYVGLGSYDGGCGFISCRGAGFGTLGDKSGEFRGLLESGFVF